MKFWRLPRMPLVGLQVVVGLILVFLSSDTCHASHAMPPGHSKRYADVTSGDSMAYDDVIRSVPKSLRAAHDKGMHLWESQAERYFQEVRSLRGLVEKLVRNLRDGVSNKGVPGAYHNLTVTPSNGLTPQCKVQLDAFFDALLHGKLWAYKVLDAWGKPQSGMLEVHIRSFGDYFQCKRIVGHHTVRQTGDDVKVVGLYCMATLTIYQDITDVVDVSIQEGLCVPNACTEDDVQALLDELLAVTNSSRYFTQSRIVCHPGQQMDSLAIFGLSTVSVLLAVVAMATAVDYLSDVPTKMADDDADDAVLESNGGSSVNHRHSHQPHVTSSQYLLFSSKRPAWRINRESFKVQLLLCFSLRSNFHKLFDTAPNKTDAMECIHGLRFFTMCWIIMGHTILLTAKRAENYVSYARIIAPYFLYQIYYNSTFACDSFLCFSGILVCYNVLHTLNYFKGKMRWHLFYIYRYMRLTPAMAFVMLIYVSTFQYWNDGPVWELGGVEPHRCKYTWWHNLLYINNFFHNQCMGWLWYLAVDTQLYCISPIFVLVLYRRPRVGIALLCLCMAVSLAVTGYVVYDLQLPPTSVSVLADNMTAKADPMTNYYYAPYIRLSPYIIGLLTGYLFYVTDRKIHIPLKWQVVGWSLAIPSGVLIIFGLYRATLLNPDLVPVTLTQAVMYSTLSRPAWALIICWVIVVCVSGHGGFLNAMLSWRPLVPLARTTYMAYMIHIIIQLWWLLSREKPVTITDSGMTLHFLGYVLITFMLAMPASLVFETPIMSIQRLMITRHEKQQAQNRALGESTDSATSATAVSAQDQGQIS